jgi:uncharacterized protein (DUF779 family)
MADAERLSIDGKPIWISLPQYQDIDAALKIIDEALTKAGKK